MVAGTLPVLRQVPHLAGSLFPLNYKLRGPELQVCLISSLFSPFTRLDFCSTLRGENVVLGSLHQSRGKLQLGFSSAHCGLVSGESDELFSSLNAIDFIHRA